jgi:hypothetical protein
MNQQKSVDAGGKEKKKKKTHTPASLQPADGDVVQGSQELQHAVEIVHVSTRLGNPDDVLQPSSDRLHLAALDDVRRRPKRDLRGKKKKFENLRDS